RYAARKLDQIHLQGNRIKKLAAPHRGSARALACCLRRPRRRLFADIRSGTKCGCAEGIEVSREGAGNSTRGRVRYPSASPTSEFSRDFDAIAMRVFLLSSFTPSAGEAPRAREELDKDGRSGPLSASLPFRVRL